MSCRCRQQLAACSTLRRVRSTARFSSAPLRTLCTPRLTHASRCRRARPTGSHSFTYVASHTLHCTALHYSPHVQLQLQCSAVQYECAVASLTCACVGRPQGHASRTSLAAAAAAAAGGESHRSELAAAAAFDTLSEEGGGGDADTMPLLTGSLDGRIVLLDVEAKRPLLVTQVKVTRLDYITLHCTVTQLNVM